MTTTPPSTTCRGPAPTVLLSWAAGQVRQAAAAQWPGAEVRLLEHVPSVTGYVQRVEVSGRPLYAKLSVLGASLVSVVNGAYGSWEEVRRRQRAYAAQRGGLLYREAAHLRLLAEAGRPRVASVAAIRDGVLFTEPVAGVSMADRLARRPGEAVDLLEAVGEDLAVLHALDPARLGTAQITERSIRGTFARKFTGGSYLRQADVPRLPESYRRAVTVLLRAAVSRLARCPVPAERPAVVYGDLKPEHVITTDGGGLVLLDPGLRLAGEVEDLARLVSRTLLLAVTQLPAEDATVVINSVGVHVGGRARSQPDPGRWLRGLAALWLMDTVNIVSTYLAAPAGLPLPGLAASVVEPTGAVSVAAMVQEASLMVEGTAPGDLVWERALTCARKAVCR